VRDPSAVAFGLVFAKIYDETFGGTFGDMRAAAQVWQLTQYSVSYRKKMPGKTLERQRAQPLEAMPSRSHGTPPRPEQAASPVPVTRTGSKLPRGL